MSLRLWRFLFLLPRATISLVLINVACDRVLSDMRVERERTTMKKTRTMMIMAATKTTRMATTAMTTTSKTKIRALQAQIATKQMTTRTTTSAPGRRVGRVALALHRRRRSLQRLLHAPDIQLPRPRRLPVEHAPNDVGSLMKKTMTMTSPTTTKSRLHWRPSEVTAVDEDRAKYILYESSRQVKPVVVLLVGGRGVGVTTSRRGALHSALDRQAALTTRPVHLLFAALHGARQLALLALVLVEHGKNGVTLVHVPTSADIANRLEKLFLCDWALGIDRCCAAADHLHIVVIVIVTTSGGGDATIAGGRRVAVGTPPATHTLCARGRGVVRLVAKCLQRFRHRWRTRGRRGNEMH